MIPQPKTPFSSTIMPDQKRAISAIMGGGDARVIISVGRKGEELRNRMYSVP